MNDHVYIFNRRISGSRTNIIELLELWECAKDSISVICVAIAWVVGEPEELELGQIAKEHNLAQIVDVVLAHVELSEIGTRRERFK